MSLPPDPANCYFSTSHLSLNQLPKRRLASTLRLLRLVSAELGDVLAAPFRGPNTGSSRQEGGSQSSSSRLQNTRSRVNMGAQRPTPTTCSQQRPTQRGPMPLSALEDNTACPRVEVGHRQEPRFSGTPSSHFGAGRHLAQLHLSHSPPSNTSKPPLC